MKVTGSYTNVIGGVSEQEPFSRYDGQMSEQVNMVSDPLVGLVRRHGSKVQDTAPILSVSLNRWDDIKKLATDYVSYQTAIDSQWYDIVYRKAQRVGNYFLEMPIAVNKYDKETDKPSIVDVEYHGASQLYLAEGVSAITTVGRYVLMAPVSKQAQFGNSPMNFAFRKGGVVWIRGGLFSREYTAKFSATHPTTGVKTRHTVKYKTNPGTYPEPLDTSGVDWANPNYQKLLNDLTAQYNSAVTIYTSEAAKKIQPTYIAAQISRLMAIAIGFPKGADVGSGPVVEGLPVKPGASALANWVLKADHVHSVTVHTLNNGKIYGETHTYQKGDNLGQNFTCPRCVSFRARLQPTAQWHDKNTFGAPGWVNPGGSDGYDMSSFTERPGGLTWPKPSKTMVDPWAEGFIDGAQVDVPWGEPISTPAVPIQMREGYIILPTAEGGWIIDDIDIADGGSDDLVRACQKEVANVDQLTPKHIAGTVVEIKPDRGKESFGVYMKAESTAGVVDGTFSEVTWNESTPDHAYPINLFCIGTVHEGVFHVASDPKILKDILGLDIPQYMPREVGDDNSSPIPDIDGRTITYMGMFQDRLLIAAGNVLLFSRPGDYFNFFRKSALRIDDSDPVEVYPTGSEGDSISAAVPSGRNFFLFGDGYQYLLGGSTVLTPMNAGAVMQLSSFDNDSSVTPVASGNYTFYPSVGQFGTSLQEIPSAYLTESPETSSASQQLKFYIKGNVRQIDAITNPNTVVLLSDGLPNGCYFMRYEDKVGAAGHQVNAWYKWEWSPLMGQSLGVALRSGAMIVPFIRAKIEGDTAHLFYVLESFSLDTRVSNEPYLDSLVPRQDLGTSLWHNNNPELNQDTAALAYANGSPYWLMGVPYRSDLAEDIKLFDHLWLGLNYPAFVEPTNPVIRDQTGKANRTGTLTVGMLNVRCADTGGAVLMRYDQYGSDPRVLKKREGTSAYTAEFMGGERPVGNWTIQGYVGRASSAFQYRVHAMSWLPLNIVKIDWTGQYFNSGGKV